MFRTVITPRASETDGAGHINNTVAPVWFEAGRRGIFLILNPDLSFEDWHAMIANLTVDCKAQTYLDEDCVVETWIERIGAKSFVVGERTLQGDHVCTTGTATYVYFDAGAQASRPIPDDVRTQLEAHLKTDDVG